MTTIISSQRHRDDDIIAEKIKHEDYEVMLSPEFELEGVTYQVVLDGHHSYEAARQAGVEPDYWVADSSDHDAIGLLNNGQIDDFLMVVHMGNDYYDIDTGKDIW